MKTIKALRSPACRVALNVAAAAVAGCFASANVAQTNPLPTNPLPTGEQIVSGSASFARAGNNLTVTNSANAIINWQTFSIGSQNGVHFDQPSVSSAVLNRVLANDPSVILGTLSSNGRVFLVNPAGIFVGADAKLDLAGFAASTLDIRDQNFLAGKLLFEGGANAGSVRNFGLIKTPTGGSVYLIAPQVENHGVIEAPNGEIILAAGHSVQLADSATPGVKVEVSGDGQALNLGHVLAESGRVGMVGALVQNKGTLAADSVVSEGGRIFLRASKKLEVDAAGRIVANGTAGGEVSLQSGDMALVSGQVEAKGSSGKGGQIDVLGDKVGLLGGARIDASGETGGGQVRVGGDYQGKNAAVQNASVTYVAPDAAIRADAGTSGNGGKIIVWADDTTRFYGTNSARGGETSGGGGFVEVSGKRYLDYQGVTDTRAPTGQAGMLLLDPSDITITNTADAYGTGVFSGGIFSGAQAPATITWATIVNQLGLGSVSITTSGSGGYGDITIANGATFSSFNPLSLLANRDIKVLTNDQGVINNGFGEIKLVAGWDSNTAAPGVLAGYGGILFNGTNADISSSGPLTLLAGTDIKRVAGGKLVTSGSAVTLQAYGGGIGFDSINSYGGSVSINAYGSIVGNSVDTSSNSTFVNGGSVNISATTPGGGVQLGQITTNGTSNAGYGAGSSAGGVFVDVEDGDITIGQIFAIGGNAGGSFFNVGYGGGNGGQIQIRANPFFAATSAARQVTVNRIESLGGLSGSGLTEGGYGGSGSDISIFNQNSLSGSGVRVGALRTVGQNGADGVYGGNGGIGGRITVTTVNGSVTVDPTLVPGGPGMLETRGGNGGNGTAPPAFYGNGGSNFGILVQAYGGDITLAEAGGYGSVASSIGGARGTNGSSDGPAQSIALVATGNIELAGHNGKVLVGNVTNSFNSITLAAGWDGATTFTFPDVGSFISPVNTPNAGSIRFNNASANIFSGGGEVRLLAGGAIGQAAAGVGGAIDTQAFATDSQMHGGSLIVHSENGDILLGDIITSGKNGGAVTLGPAPSGGWAGGVSIEVGSSVGAIDTAPRSIIVGNVTAIGGYGGTSTDIGNGSGGSGGVGGVVSLSTEFANYGGSVTVGDVVLRGGNGGNGAVGGPSTDGGAGGGSGSISLLTGVYGGDIIFSSASPILETRGGNGGLAFGGGFAGSGGSVGSVTFDSAGGGFDLTSKAVLIRSLDGFNGDGSPAGGAGGVFLGSKLAITQGAGAIEIGYGGLLELNAQSNVTLNNSSNVLHGVAGVVGGNLTLVTQGSLDIGSSILELCDGCGIIPVVSPLTVGGSASLEAVGADASVTVSGPLQYAAAGTGSLQLIAGQSIRVIDSVTSGYGGNLSLLSNRAGLGGGVSIGFVGNPAPTFGDRANADQQVFLKSYGGDIVIRSFDGSPAQGTTTGGYGGPGVSIYANAVITSEGGNIDIAGRGDTSGNSGLDRAKGIVISKASLGYGATIDAGGGTLTLTGYGGNDPLGTNVGVLLLDGTTLATTGNGSIAIAGYGGSSASYGENVGFAALGAVNNYGGVFISTSGTGGISIAGYGGTGTVDNDGVFFEDTTVSAGSAIGTGGPVSLYGTASQNGIGVGLWFSRDAADNPTVGSGTHVFSYGSGVTVTGIGQGGIGEGQSSGIIVAHQSSIGAYGGISLTGSVTSGPGGLQPYGGEIGGIGIGNHGVVIADHNFFDGAYGTLVYDNAARNGGAVHSFYGSVSVVGTSDASAGDFNNGVTIAQGGSVIGATGVSITGYGGTGSNLNKGVALGDGANVVADAGNLTIIGESRANGGNFSNVGVGIDNADVYGGGTLLSITGVGNGLNDGDGIRLSNSNIHLDAPGRVLIEGTGSIVAGAAYGHGVALGGNQVARSALPLIEARSGGRVDVVGSSQTGGAIVFDSFTAGVSTATIYGGVVHLKSLNGDINLDSTTIQANLVAFTLAGNLTQTSNTGLGSGQLLVTGVGSADLQPGFNDFSEVAADLTGAFKLSNGTGVALASITTNSDYGGIAVGGVNGVTASGDITIGTLSGGITQSGTSGLTTQTGNVSLTAYGLGAAGTPIDVAGTPTSLYTLASYGDIHVRFAGDLNSDQLDIQGGITPRVVDLEAANTMLLNPDFVTGAAFDVSGDTLVLSANGDISFASNGGFTNASSITVTSQTGSIVMAGGGSSHLDTTTAYAGSGNITLNSGNLMSLGTISAAGLLRATSGSDITLNAPVSAAAGNDAIILAATSNFHAGPSATLTTPAGRWLVFSTDPANDTRGSLVYDFKQYNHTYGGFVGLGGASLLAATNQSGFSYSVAPTLSASIAGPVSKTYDGNADASALVTLSPNGLIDGDTALVTASSAAFADQHAGTGKSVTAYGLSYATSNGPVSVFGYQVTGTATYGGGIIDPAALTATLTNTGVTRDYDGTTTAVFTPTFGVSGLVTGDTTASFSVASQDFNTSHVVGSDHVVVSGLALTAVSGSNGSLPSDYLVNSGVTTLASGASTASITPAALSATLTNTGVTRDYDGTTTAVFTPTFGVSGLVTGDTAASFSVASQDFNTSHVVGSDHVVVSSLALTAVSGSNGSLPSDYLVNSGVTTLASGASTASITPAALSATLTNTGVTKVYDGSTAAPAGFTPTYSISGLAYGDTAAAITNTGASYDNQHVAYASSITVSGLALGPISGSLGSLSSDYLLTTSSVSVPAVITRANSLWTGGAGDGLWSSAANWSTNAVPLFNDAISVNLGGANVTYDLGTTTLVDMLNGSGTLTVQGTGPLSIASLLSTSGFAQTAGSVVGNGNFTVSQSFSQTGGTISLGGGSVANITQSSGALSIGNLAATNVFLSASAGDIVQTGPISATALTVNASGAVTLTGSNNSFSILSGTAGTGVSVVDHASGSSGPLTVNNVATTAGNIAITNFGPTILSGTLSAPAGTVTVAANSPLSVSGTVTAGTGITLTAASTGDLSLNGTLTTSSGNIEATAGGAILMSAASTATASSGLVSMNASNDIMVGRNTGTTVDLTSTSGSVLTSSEGMLNVSSERLIVRAANNVALLVNVGSADITAGGTVTITDLKTATTLTNNSTVVDEMAKTVNSTDSFETDTSDLAILSALAAGSNGSGATSGLASDTIGGTTGNFGGDDTSSANGNGGANGTKDGGSAKKGKDNDKDKNKPGRCLS
jgi:trimeric autotransporter adhesin